MGNFYVNYTLRGPSQEAAAKALIGRNAIVTPMKDDCVVVFDEQSDSQDTEVIADLAKHLSRECNCPVWAVLNHDDDVFWYQLYIGGELVDEYDSSPGYFDATEPSPPEGGDARKLCSGFGASNVAEVDRALRTPVVGGYMFAIQRHGDLVDLLGIPSFGVGAGYSNVAAGEETDGLDEQELLRVQSRPKGRSGNLDGINSLMDIDFKDVNRRALTSLIRGIEQKRGGAVALREATRHGLVDEIQRLIESGVDVNSRTERGGTALMYAYSAKIGGLLIRHGADVNARDDGGNTPLIWFLRALAKKGTAEKYLRLLVASGVDVSVRSSDGRSAYSLAEEKYGPQVAKLLEPK